MYTSFFFEIFLIPSHRRIGYPAAVNLENVTVISHSRHPPNWRPPGLIIVGCMWVTSWSHTKHWWTCDMWLKQWHRKQIHTVSYRIMHIYYIISISAQCPSNLWVNLSSPNEFVNFVELADLDQVNPENQRDRTQLNVLRAFWLVVEPKSSSQKRSKATRWNPKKTKRPREPLLEEFTALKRDSLIKEIEIGIRHCMAKMYE